jgi:anti-sigma B factor antagonist
MKIIQEEENDHKVYILKGRLDTMTSPLLEEQVLTDIAQKRAYKIIFDIQEVDYVSSAGLRVFLQVAKKLHGQNERLTVRGMKAKVKEVFRISGFLDFFNIE